MLCFTGVNEDKVITFNNCTAHSGSTVYGLWFVAYTRTVYVTMIDIKAAFELL